MPSKTELMPSPSAFSGIASMPTSDNEARAALTNLVSLSQLTAWAQPRDMVGLWKCLVLQGRYDDTPFVKAAFIAFGLFDVWRVTDPTAHTALDEMHADLQGLIADSEKSKYAAAQAKLGDPLFMEKVRNFVMALGPPQYHPSYMIDHGVGLSSGEHERTQGLREDVVPETAWTSVIEHLFPISLGAMSGENAADQKT